MTAQSRVEKSMDRLKSLLSREEANPHLTYEEFLAAISENPKRILRNIFQLTHDMAHYYVPAGVNEYPNDPESINYIRYDTSRFFVEDTETAFFADRLLANRLMNVLDSLKEGVLRNKMLLFVGPPGSGKSTFLNNFLRKLENFTKTEEGTVYETIWQIDLEAFGLTMQSLNIMESNVYAYNSYLHRQDKPDESASHPLAPVDNKLLVPCPSHDHPFIQIPKQYRRNLLEELIDDREFKMELFHHKEYEWVLKSEPCAICTSIYKALSEKLSPEDVLSTLFARRFEFNRRLGEGISVFNPGDKMIKRSLDNPEIQRWLGAIFKDSNMVPYMFSRLAMTNNGVFAIMDAKSSNIDRIKNIHGVISDGIHKVETIEENINSLFIALINPEDIRVIHEEKSFLDRVVKIPIPYVRDYMTEVAIYKNFFGEGIEEHFLPMVLTSFAKTIVASRLNRDSKALPEWIDKPEQYAKFCDKNLLLLKMEIYSGSIPFWLSESDVKLLDKNMRRRIILEGDDEGRKGFSGRESLEMFNHFYLRYRNSKALISMKCVTEFFKEKKYHEKLPEDFLDSLVSLYDYIVLQQVKEAMFYYNKTQIAKDIKNYLFAITNDVGSDVVNPATGDLLEVTEEYLEMFEKRLLKSTVNKKEREIFRSDTLTKYVSKTLQEVKSGDELMETNLYQSLFSRYSQNLKENVLDPFINNANFRNAIKDFGTDQYRKYDKRIRDEVDLLMKNLKFTFNYTEDGAQQICIYVIDEKLVEKFKEK